MRWRLRRITARETIRRFMRTRWTLRKAWKTIRVDSVVVEIIVARALWSVGWSILPGTIQASICLRIAIVAVVLASCANAVDIDVADIAAANLWSVSVQAGTCLAILIISAGRRKKKIHNIKNLFLHLEIIIILWDSAGRTVLRALRAIRNIHVKEAGETCALWWV